MKTPSNEDRLVDTYRRLAGLPPRRRLIFGMVPWMFWLLLGVTLFALFSPFVVVAIRHLHL